MQIRKGVRQVCILSPCSFNLYAEYIVQNARLDEAQTCIKISGRNINDLRYADDTALMAEGEEELKSLLIKWWKGFPCDSAGKESACNARDLGSIPGLGRSPGEGTGYPLQYSGLENSRDCTVHRLAKSQIRLSDFHSHQWWLMKVKEESEKAGLKVNIPKTKIMASSPITSCK